MSLFVIGFRYKPRIALETFVPHIDNTELDGGLEEFIEQRKQILREVRKVLGDIATT